MAQDIFAITLKEKSVKLDAATRRGKLTFSVGNTLADRAVKARAQAVPSGGTKAEWLKTAPETQVLPPSTTQQVTVEIAAPEEVAAGSYGFVLRVADDDRPDDYASSGPPASFEVGARPVKPPTPWKKWLLVALVALVVLGGGAWVLVCKVFGKCGTTALAFGEDCVMDDPAAKPCGNELVCAALPTTGATCRRVGGVACAHPTDCASLWCKKTHKCSPENGACTTEPDPSGDPPCVPAEHFVCVGDPGKQLCRKKNGESCTVEAAALCATTYCNGTVCAPPPVPCGLECPRLQHCVSSPSPHCELREFPMILHPDFKVRRILP
jgi:hypothetical protein